VQCRAKYRQFIIGKSNCGQKKKSGKTEKNYRLHAIRGCGIESNEYAIIHATSSETLVRKPMVRDHMRHRVTTESTKMTEKSDMLA